MRKGYLRQRMDKSWANKAKIDVVISGFPQMKLFCMGSKMILQLIYNKEGSHLGQKQNFRMEKMVTIIIEVDDAVCENNYCINYL